MYANLHALFLSLKEQGMIDPKTLSDHQFTIFEQSRRNQNIIIANESDEGFFVKRANSMDHQWTVSREAEILQYIRSVHSTSYFAPRLLSWQPEKQVMITRMVSNARSMASYYRQQKRYYPSIAKTMGEQVGLLHTIPPPSCPQMLPPWILEIHKPTLEHMKIYSPALLHFVRFIQSDEILCKHMDRLAQSWQSSTFIHRDLKFDNILMHRSSRKKKYEITLTDWEISGGGDPHWDIGSIVSEYLYYWVQSTHLIQADPSLNQVQTNIPLESLIPSIHAFVYAYLQTSKPDHKKKFLGTCVQYAGVRLIQFLYEGHRKSHSFGKGSALALQLAANLIKRPAEATFSLLRFTL